MSSIGRWLAFSVLVSPIVALASENGGDREGQRAGYIDSLETVSTYDAYGGASFGKVGPYQVIVAIAHGCYGAG